jgi:hypothetical protein
MPECWRFAAFPKGAVAFRRTGDPSTGDFSNAKVIRKFGDVPDDLSALQAAGAAEVKGRS